MRETESDKYPLVILSSVEWDFLWQRQQILATHFACTGHRVIYVIGLALGSSYLDPSSYARHFKKLWRKAWSRGDKRKKQELPPNLTIYAAVTAPAKPRVLRWMSRRFFVPRIVKDLGDMGVENPVIWSFHPTDTALQVAKGLEPRALVYDCVTSFAQLPQVPNNIAKTEEEWVATADLVVVDSSFLREKHTRRRPDVVQIPPGVDYERFNRAYSEADPRVPVRKVCFFGGMGAHWFDFHLVEGVADAGFEVSLIGYREDPQHRLFSHPNVSYVPPVLQAELPSLLKPMDALLMPYKINDFTQAVFPSKSYECLATGKPVVATPLPDIKGKLSEYVYLAGDAEGFIEVLRRLPKLETRDKIQTRMALARANSWQSRLESISRELELLLHNRRGPSGGITS